MNEYKVIVHYIATAHGGAKLADFRIFYISASNKTLARSKARGAFSRQSQGWKRNDRTIQTVDVVRVLVEQVIEQLPLPLSDDSDDPHMLIGGYLK